MKMNMMRNDSDENYGVNSVVDSGTDEWHVIADTELEEEITASAATVQTSYYSPQQLNSRLLREELPVYTQIRRKNRKRMDWLLVTWLWEAGEESQKSARDIRAITAPC